MSLKHTLINPKSLWNQYYFPLDISNFTACKFFDFAELKKSWTSLLLKWKRCKTYLITTESKKIATTQMQHAIIENPIRIPFLVWFLWSLYDIIPRTPVIQKIALATISRIPVTKGSKMSPKTSPCDGSAIPKETLRTPIMSWIIA